MKHYQLAIIGGGIAGLSSAWYAQQHDISYTLIESSGRWGGKIQTETISNDWGTVRVEHGADSFITQKPWVLQLVTQLGIEDELIGIQKTDDPVFVLNDGQLKNLPEGMMMIVPTKFTPFALSSLISPLGKLRMGVEALIPSRQDDGDESLAQFVRRRLGNEALDKLAEPLMSGIYNADAETQSLMATFPRFRKLEQEFGSLTQGIFAMKKQRATIPKTGTPKPMFMSFRNGMESFVDNLVSRLRGDLRLQTHLTTLQKSSNGYALTLSNGQTITADHVLLAIPTYRAIPLLEEIAPLSADTLHTIDYVDTGTVTLAYRKEDIHALRSSTGLVIPRIENRHINAITVSSNKFENRAPDDIILMRVFYGGARSPQTFAQDDASLLETVKNELYDILGIDADPLLTRIVRTPQATPQYHVGHLDNVAQIEATLPQGVWVTGSAYLGLGVPDCIHQAQAKIAQIATV